MLNSFELEISYQSLNHNFNFITCFDLKHKSMKSYVLNIYAILLLLTFNNCNSQTNKTASDTSNKNIEPNPWPPSDSLRYVALKDSAKLVHIKNQFYRNKVDTLFEKMYAPKNPIDLDAGAIGFFRITNQQVDPLTFEVIDDSWFARDKNFVYNYRGNDSGMFCITIPEADVKYFKLLPCNSGIYGADRKHVFKEAEIIEHLDPLNMRVITDKEGDLLKIISGRYMLDATSGMYEAVLIKHTKKHTPRSVIH